MKNDMKCDKCIRDARYEISKDKHTEFLCGMHLVLKVPSVIREEDMHKLEELWDPIVNKE